MYEPAIIVHGGVDMSVELIQQKMDGVKAAAKKGHSVLLSGGSAVDAVVASVSAMEDDVVFNAGHGSALTLKGEVELDAIVIEGDRLDSGAVCGLKGCRNPIQLARLVMEKTNHCLLSGKGANEFMESQGIECVPDSQLVTPWRRADWQNTVKLSGSRQYHSLNRFEAQHPSGCDTVGAVAMDAHGNIATATSTGGTTAKLPGRIGDAPIIGSGAYADNKFGGASSTGHGESIMKVCLTRRVFELIEQGMSAEQAVVQALKYMTDRVGGEGGVIVLSKGGEREGSCQFGRGFTSDRMAWASVSKGCLKWGIEPDQELSELL